MSNNQNNNQDRTDREVTFEILESIGEIKLKDSGWCREVNLVRWNGGTPKIDIREWNPTHTRMSKGITLFEEDAEQLAIHLCKRYGITASNVFRREAEHKAQTEDKAEGTSVAEQSDELPYEDGMPASQTAIPASHPAASPA